MNQPEHISTWDLLPELGFVEDPQVISDRMPGLSFDFGNFKLSASHVLGRHFRPVVLLTGVYRNNRVVGMVAEELPTEVESIEQCMAWLAWSVEGVYNRQFTTTIIPPWLQEGRNLSHLLPWERERTAYAARPFCSVQRDWARMALKKLAEQLAAVDNDEEIITLSFDGKVLTICCADRVIPTPAEGIAWKESYSIKAGSLRRLPARLMRDPVVFSVWEEGLWIGNRCYKVAEPFDSATAC